MLQLIDVTTFIDKLELLKEYMRCWVDYKNHRKIPVVLDLYFRDIRKPKFEEWLEIRIHTTFNNQTKNI